jgi:hypothetical protein
LSQRSLPVNTTARWDEAATKAEFTCHAFGTREPQLFAAALQTLPRALEVALESDSSRVDRIAFDPDYVVRKKLESQGSQQC